MSDKIEVSFTPTAKDYAIATRWIGKRSLGGLFWLNLVAAISIAIGGAFGFILLIDAALSHPTTARQGLTGALLFVAALYIGLLLKLVLRRFVNRRVYNEGGFFLSPRTLVFDEYGVQNNSPQQQIRIAWKDVMGIHEGKCHLFIQLEPAFTLFIPKRIAKDASEIARLKEFAEKMRSESAAKI